MENNSNKYISNKYISLVLMKQKIFFISSNKNSKFSEV